MSGLLRLLLSSHMRFLRTLPRRLRTLIDFTELMQFAPLTDFFPREAYQQLMCV